MQLLLLNDEYLHRDIIVHIFRGVKHGSTYKLPFNKVFGFSGRSCSLFHQDLLLFGG